MKALLEPYEQGPCDGTVWHGVYSRILLKEDTQFLPQDDLSGLPFVVSLYYFRLLVVS